MLQLTGIVVLLVLTVVGFRSCSASPASSTSNPVNVARNGLAGICAEQEAVAAAGGPGAAGGPSTVISPALQQQLQASDPGGLTALEGALGGPLTCATTTTVP